MGSFTDPSNRKGKKYIIGVDPDTDNCGFAEINSGNWKESLHLSLVHHVRIVHFIIKLINREEFLFRIEAGWLNPKANHRKGGSPSLREKIAQKVGRNNQVGITIEEACKIYGVDYELVVPKQTKTTPEQFKLITGQDIKNQEMIDAAMLIIGM